MRIEGFAKYIDSLIIGINATEDIEEFERKFAKAEGALDCAYALNFADMQEWADYNAILMVNTIEVRCRLLRGENNGI